MTEDELVVGLLCQHGGKALPASDDQVGLGQRDGLDVEGLPGGQLLGALRLGLLGPLGREAAIEIGDTEQACVGDRDRSVEREQVPGEPGREHRDALRFCWNGDLAPAGLDGPSVTGTFLCRGVAAGAGGEAEDNCSGGSDRYDRAKASSAGL